MKESIMKDTVTVVIPFYNDGSWVREAVHSVRCQTYPEVEIILVDDGSDDQKSRDIFHSLQFENLKKISIPHHGPSAARNAGIKAGHGEWILPLDADDMMEPSYIEKAVQIMKNNPHAGIVYCMADQFGKAAGAWNLPPFSMGTMLLHNVIFITALFRREDWIKAGGFDETFQDGIEDYYFCLSLLEIGRDVYQIPEILFHYRVKKRSRNAGFMQNPVRFREYFAHIQEKHKRLYQEHAMEFTQMAREELINQQYRILYLQEQMEHNGILSRLIARLKKNL